MKPLIDLNPPNQFIHLKNRAKKEQLLEGK